jgi:hypothetical protein
MRLARNERAERQVDSDELVDADVPAAVVCARCGQADCAGCSLERSLSGVMAIVPWERPGASLPTRLWATARATARDPERFFESLPDGPLAPALRFAIVAELVAVTAMALSAVIPVALLAPGWLSSWGFSLASPLLRLALLALPALAVLLVAAHVVHGWALDRGARRSGARGATSRALRFGLYSTGWDLVVGPLGAIVLAVREGPAAALSLGTAGMGLPTRSAHAFLRGCYGLTGDGARPAMRAGYAAAIVVTLIGAAFVVAVIVSALFL